jgi:GNAT superfamily N-acetyltransferase
MILRNAEPADALAIAEVHVRAWQVAYRGLLTDEYLDGLRPEDRAKKYTLGSTDGHRPTTIVAVEDGVICGFATTMPAHDADAAGSGELAALYVDPKEWGKGMGLALIQAARAQLRARGFRRAVLWVLVGNKRAQRFYEKDGWRLDGSRRLNQVWGATVDEVRMARGL